MVLTAVDKLSFRRNFPLLSQVILFLNASVNSREFQNALDAHNASMGEVCSGFLGRALSVLREPEAAQSPLEAGKRD